MHLFISDEFASQIAVRAGGFSALVVVGMAVIGIAVLYATFYVWLGVDSPSGMKVTDRKFLPLISDFNCQVLSSVISHSIACISCSIACISHP